MTTQPPAEHPGRDDGDGDARSRRQRQTVDLLTERARIDPGAGEGSGDAERERAALLEQAVLLNMPVARSIASRYRGRGIPDEDLAQVAYLALVKAAQRFDPLRRKDFLSYAVPTIRGEVKRWFRDRGWVVRPTRRIQELQQAVFGADAELSQELGRSPRPAELAEHLGVDVDDVRDALATDGAFSPLSLDVPVTEDGFGTVGDLITDDGQDAEAAEARVLLAPAIRALAPRDRRILRMRFAGGRTQQEIADDLGVTQMQVSRLLSRILRTLRTRLEDPMTPVSRPQGERARSTSAS